jgi:UDP-perosamine 4-acetyltransferase
MDQQSSVLIVGAGGHAKVVIELFRAEQRYHIAGLVGPSASAPSILGVPVIGGDVDLPRLRGEGIGHAFVAIGDNARRTDIGRSLERLGFGIVNAISPAAIISPTACLGYGIAIMAGVVINADCRIGNYAIINTRASIDHEGSIGEGAHIAPGTTLAGNVTVGALAFLGVGTHVIPTMSIGEGAIVGAGSCVVRSIPPRALARGVPARVVSSYEGPA